jgi:hypothetical protein
MSQSVTIKSCASREEAEFFKSLLESNGVHAHVLADDYVGLPLTISDGVQLQVLEEDVDQARQILDDAKSDDDDAKVDNDDATSDDEDAKSDD